MWYNMVPLGGNGLSNVHFLPHGTMMIEIDDKKYYELLSPKIATGYYHLYNIVIMIPYLLIEAL